MLVDRGAFVGRQRELAALERGLAAARGGDGGLVLIEGESGMGKTALAHELTRRARRDRAMTCWGACLEGEGASAYRPWTQILRGLGAVPDMLLARDVDSRSRLFEETVDVLRAAPDERGMLVVLDDLHWADVASVRLLQALATAVADSGLFVVGLYRGAEIEPGAELAVALGAVLRERAVSRMVLGGMTPAEVERLAAEVLQRPPDAVLLGEVERAEGNPLFVVELVRLAVAPGAVTPGAVTPGATRGALPAGVRDVIGRRLDRLPKPTRRVLRQASVLGREFAVPLLADVAGVPASRVADLLDAAIEADLVVAGDGPSLRFAHSLMQEVAYGELSHVERPRLHQRAAEAIGESEHLVDLRAHHLRRAASLNGAAPALEATLSAARRAWRQLAYEHAAFQYGQALVLLDQLPQATVSRRHVLLDVARCQFRVGAVAHAWSTCRAAADLGRAAGDPATVGEAATIIRGLANDPICDEIHALCREALTLLHGADPVLEARLLGQLAVTANRWAGGVEPGLSQRALLAAEATIDPDALFLALQARHTDLKDFRYAPERLAIGERAVQLGRDTGRDECLVWGHQWRLDAFWELSRRAQMDAELAALTGVVAHLKEPLSRWRLTMIQASLAMLEGRYGDAAAQADEALVIGRRGGHHEADFVHVVFGSNLAPLVGDTDTLTEVEVFVRQFAQEGPFLARFWHARVLADLGRLDEASEVWASVLPHLDAFPRYAPEWIMNLIAVADLCVLLDRPEIAAGAYADLLPFADRQATGGAHGPSRGPVALYLGRLARLLADAGAAEAHLATALRLAAAMGSPPYEAMTRVQIARLMLSRRGPGDRAQAEAHLETATQIARRLGMRPLQAEASALLAAQRGGRSTPLSRREEEVAALIAKGLSNRQVATRLHLSERTVETHVRSIFNKLGFDSRARVASWFASLPPRD